MGTPSGKVRARRAEGCTASGYEQHKTPPLPSGISLFKKDAYQQSQRGILSRCFVLDCHIDADGKGAPPTPNQPAAAAANTTLRKWSARQIAGVACTTGQKNVSQCHSATLPPTQPPRRPPLSSLRIGCWIWGFGEYEGKGLDRDACM